MTSDAKKQRHNIFGFFQTLATRIHSDWLMQLLFREGQLKMLSLNKEIKAQRERGLRASWKLLLCGLMGHQMEQCLHRRVSPGARNQELQERETLD